MAILAVIVVLAVVGFAGWRVANQDDNTLNSENNSSQTETVDELPDDLASIKSFEEITELAGEQAGSAQVFSVELESEDGRTVYVVKLSDGTKLMFDATTGESLGRSDDDDDDDDEQIPSGFVPGITIQKAIEIAKNERPDSRVRKVEIEVEDGVVMYSVRFTDDSRVDVSAVDGSIDRVKVKDEDRRGNDDDEDDDDEDEDDEDDDNDEDEEDDDDDDEN